MEEFLIVQPTFIEMSSSPDYREPPLPDIELNEDLYNKVIYDYIRDNNFTTFYGNEKVRAQRKTRHFSNNMKKPCIDYSFETNLNEHTSKQIQARFTFPPVEEHKCTSSASFIPDTPIEIIFTEILNNKFASQALNQNIKRSYTKTNIFGRSLNELTKIDRFELDFDMETSLTIELDEKYRNGNHLETNWTIITRDLMNPPSQVTMRIDKKYECIDLVFSDTEYYSSKTVEPLVEYLLDRGMPGITAAALDRLLIFDERDVDNFAVNFRQGAISLVNEAEYFIANVNRKNLRGSRF